MKKRRFFQNLIVILFLSAGLLLSWNSRAYATEGMLAYGDTSDNIPKYQSWNGTSWVSEAATATDSSALNYWVVLKACPTRDEYILGAIDASGHIHIQVWDGGSWGDALNITDSDAVYLRRKFDIAYEQTSGDALVLYNRDEEDPWYYTWDGGTWTGPTELDLTTAGTGKPTYIALAPKKDSNEIMMAMVNGDDDIWTAHWTGSVWEDTLEAEITASNDLRECFALAWENNSGDCLLIYGEDIVTTARYRIYSGGSWGSELINGPLINNTVYWLQAASDPSSASDKIGLTSIDSGADWRYFIWDGSSWGLSGPEDATCETATYRDTSIAWIGTTGTCMAAASADASLLHISYNIWNGTTWGSITDCTDNAGDDIEWIRLLSDPDADEVMCITIELTGYGICSQRYVEGTGWSYDGARETLGSEYHGECAMFAYRQYTPSAVTVNSITDGENPITSGFTAGDYLNDKADHVVNMTLLNEPSADPVLWWDTEALPDGDGSSDTSVAKDSGTWPGSYQFTIDHNNAEIADGNTVQVAFKVDTVMYYLTTGPDTAWKYTVDGAVPTNVGCNTPGNNDLDVPTSTPLVALTAADSGSGSVQYYFQLATNIGFTENEQHSDWQSSTSWSPSLDGETVYYWRVKAKDKVGNESAQCGHTHDEAGYGTFTTAAKAVINALMAYYEGSEPNINPSYRTWDGTNWSSEGEAGSLGTDADAHWVIVRADPKANKYILGTLDDLEALKVQIYDGDSWGTVTTIIDNSGATVDRRWFDIAYERQSGNIMVVYMNDSAETIPYYQFWNGSTWSAGEQCATIGDGNLAWVRLEAKPKTDSNEIILATEDSNKNIYAQVWNGSTWGNATKVNVACDVATNQSFDVAYEQLSGHALVVYQDVDDIPRYSIWEASSWGTGGNCTARGAGDQRWAKMASKPGSDEIILGTQDNLNDIQVEIWNGSTWDNYQEVELTAPGIGKRYFDVAYETTINQKGMIVWSDNTNIPKYCTWNGSTWSSPEAPATTVGAVPQWIALASDPSTYEIMLMTSDDDATAGPDIDVQKWNGSTWGTVTPVETNSMNSQECFGIAGNEYWPTLVGLADFQALSYERGVWLWWRTASEVGNAGFNIYRSENRDGPYTKLNDSLIPGLLYSVIGKIYWYLDSDVFDGTTYYYKLEDVDCFGKKTLHGPVWATPGIDSDNDGIPDGWEKRYGLNPNINDGGLDPDNDGFTNYEEFRNDTNPFISDIEEVISPRPPEIEEIPKEGIEIIESDEFGVTLELTTEEFDEEEKIEEGITYQRISIPGYIHGHSSEIGKPQVPMKGALLGVPSDSSIEISILDTESTTFPDYNLYPVPTQEPRKSENVKYVKEIFTKDEIAYSSDAFYPDNLAEPGFTGYKREQKVVQIKLYPIQFNPVTRELKFYKKIRVRLDFASGGTSVHRIAKIPSLFSTPAWADPSPSFPSDFPNPAYKISLSQDGIYRLTHTYLTSAGMDLSASLSTFKLYNEGSEIPIYVHDEDEADVFDSNDYIEFYGKAKDTKYTTTNAYWLTSGGATGSRINKKNNTGPSDTPESAFYSLKEEEENLRYDGLCPGADTFDRWFFNKYASVTYEPNDPLAEVSQNYTVTLKDVVSTEENARIRVTLRGYFDIPPEDNNHAKIYVNDNQVGDPDGIYWDGKGETTLNADFTQSYLNSGEGDRTQTITVQSLRDTGAKYDLIMLDTIKIDYYRSFVAENDSLKFSNETPTDHRFEISGFTTGDIEIFDITDASSPQHITFTVEGYTAKFNDTITGATTYLAQTPLTPTSIEEYINSGIRSEDNGADYIIIVSNDDFYDDDNLTSLVNHREVKGLRVKKVKVNDIYNEFNHGVFNPKAIKDFLTYAYDNWQDPKPKYCLLVGDATYDYKDNKGNGSFAHLPTYPSYTTFFGETANDNWYSWVSGGDHIPDIYIGRLPVRTSDELKYIVDKILAYEGTSSTNTWENKILLVADDDDITFETTNNGLTTGPCQVTTSYLATDHNGDASACKIAIKNAINDGVAIVNYAGHGWLDFWAHEYLFQSPSDVDSLTNGEKLPFFVSMSCTNGLFSYRTTDSLAEKLLKAENKGAIGVFASSGASCPYGQKILDEGLFKAFFGGTTHILGDAIAQAHTTFLANGSGYEDISETFSLLGDPALGLKIPFPAGDGHTYGLTCPIASAAYGTSLAEEVEVFRNFRDECLLTNRKGRAFVRFYYRHSPPISRFIEKKKALKALMRAGLKPILWLTKRATKPPHKYPIWE